MPPPETDAHVPLHQLRRGDRARVAALEGCQIQSEQLRAMGLHEACDLTVCRHGAVCIVEVTAGASSVRLAIDAELSRRVRVNHLAPSRA